MTLREGYVAKSDVLGSDVNIRRQTLRRARLCERTTCVYSLGEILTVTRNGSVRLPEQDFLASGVP